MVFKSQSAMEYLMTYGWAILIIAVVLGALFGLGFFNSANLAPKVAAGSCQVYRPQGPGTTSFINLEGTCNNELPQYVAQFNGASSAVSGSTSGVSNGAYAISFWMNPTSSGYASTNAIVFFGTVGTNDIAIAYQSNEELYINGVCNNEITTTSVIPLNAWAQVVDVNFGNGNNKLYINDNLQSSSGGNFYGCTGLGTGFDFGYSPDNHAPGRFIGQISDVQLYNASLTANEVTALYQEGIGGVPILPQSLVGWWPLNGNANDYSGNLNNGAATNVIYTGSWTSGYTAP